MTNPLIIIASCAVLSYLLGSIPFAYIIARHYGIDVRKTGSGNVGATNVLRSVGKAAGITTLLLDAAKGFLPVFLLPLFLADHIPSAPSHLLEVVCTLAAIFGHIWPVYLNFKGGKGIATSAGALVALAPPAITAGLIVWVIMFSLSKYVSLASVSAAVAIPVLAWYIYFPEGLLLPVTLTIIGLLAVIRHKSNIQRLLKGTEPRISFSKKTPAQENKPNA